MSLDLSTLKVGDRIAPVRPDGLALAPAEVLWTDGSCALARREGFSPFLVTTNDRSFDGYYLPSKWALVPPPPLIDPNQVWAEIKAMDGETYWVRDRGDDRHNRAAWVGGVTGRRLRITATEPVE